MFVHHRTVSAVNRTVCQRQGVIYNSERSLVVNVHAPSEEKNDSKDNFYEELE